MPWFYNDQLKERCEITDVQIIGVSPPRRWGEPAISTLKVKFTSSMGPGEIVRDSDDVHISKGTKAYRSEFYKRSAEQLSLFSSRTLNKLNVS